MSNPISFDSPELSVVASLEESAVALEPDTPFRILLLGDWSGRANRKVSATGGAAGERRPLPVDRDNFDEVMARLGVALHLPLAGERGPRFPLRFAELDDFHPDRLFAQLEIFASLKQTRERLGDPQTFAAAAAEVRGWNDAAPQVAASAPAAPGGEQTPPTALAVDGSDLLDQLLTEAESRPVMAQPSLGDADWNALLRDLVRPHLAPREDPQQDELLASVDETTSDLMRTILRHKDFQALEAAWRALFFLVSRLDTGADLKLYLLDISKEELAGELSAAADLRATPLFKLIVEQSVGTAGGELWSLLVGNYTFAPTREDIALLARVAKVARQAGAPFIAGASPRALGCESLAATPDPADWQEEMETENDLLWDALRRIPEASYIGLALPRFLLRLPYGAETEPTETFEFSEMAAEPEHEAYLWGNPAFACAYLLAESFSRHGWDMGHTFAQEIEGLPLHIYDTSQGESQITPCAETLLTERAASRIMERGIMPLLSFKHTDRVRLARFQSLAEPPTALAGRWH